MRKLRGICTQKSGRTKIYFPFLFGPFIFVSRLFSAEDDEQNKAPMGTTPTES